MKEEKCKKCCCDISQLPINERIGFQTFLLHCAIKNKKNQDYEAIDLTSSQVDLLMYIYHYEKEQNVQQVDLERRFNLSNPTVTGIIQRLEAKGFVTREVSESDKRCKFLHTTKQTKKVHDYMDEKRQENNELLTKGFSDEEKEELSRLLEKAITNMRQEHV